MSPSDPGDINDGPITTAANGDQYFIYGKNRIKIKEHFPTSGKQINELVEELIRQKAIEKLNKIA